MSIYQELKQSHAERKEIGYSEAEITHLPIQTVRRPETVESEKDAKLKSGAAGGLVRWHLLLMLGGRGSAGVDFGKGRAELWEILDCLSFFQSRYLDKVMIQIDNLEVVKVNQAASSNSALVRRSASRPAPRPASARSPPPQPAHHAPPPAPAQSGSGGSLLGGIGSTIAQGMAFGTGSAVAHRAVDAVMGPRTIQHETVVSEAAAAPAPATTSNSLAGTDSCSIHYKAFQDCLNSYGSELSKCQFYMDMLTECRKNTGSMLGA
ncbi:hypothetical protein Gotur_023007 [Gossypium turneri]